MVRCRVNIPTIPEIQKSEGMAQGIRGDGMTKLMTILFQSVGPGSFKKRSSFIGTKTGILSCQVGRRTLIISEHG